MSNRSFIRLSAIALMLLFAVPAAVKADTTHTYTGFLGEIPITMRITFDNIEGLGDIWGTVSYAGRTLRFNGQNSEPGFIWFRDSDGDLYELNKRNTPSTIGWAGSMNDSTTVTFTRKR